MHAVKREHASNNLLERVREVILASRNVAILTHSNADPDSLSSACIIARIVNEINPTASTRIIVSNGVGSECRSIAHFCTSMNIRMEVVKRYQQVENQIEDTCVLVDVASTEQLGYAKQLVRSCRTVIILDHHSVHEYEKDLLGSSEIIYLVDPTASSTAEIVYKFMSELNISIEVDFLKILLAGIIWDTKRFQRISANTFKYVSEMIESGVQYYEALKLIESVKPTYSRIARIKCLLRHRGFKATVGDREIYIAISEVGAYESDCATMLITIGYDVAFVVNIDESLKISRMIYRVRENLTEDLKLDIHESIVRKLIDVFGGGGGGHKGAGGAVLRTSDVKGIVTEIINVLNGLSGNNLIEFVENRVG